VQGLFAPESEFSRWVSNRADEVAALKGNPTSAALAACQTATLHAMGGVALPPLFAARVAQVLCVSVEVLREAFPTPPDG